MINSIFMVLYEWGKYSSISMDKLVYRYAYQWLLNNYGHKHDFIRSISAEPAVDAGH
jgi:hypothetical protein